MWAVELVMPAVFLVWLVATAALAVAGLRRWRWGTPGGATAALAAGVGLLFPFAVLVTAVLEQVAPQAMRWMNDSAAFQVGMGAAWLGSLWLSVLAAARVLGAARPADPTEDSR
ncbi:hypothetical protein [Alienimonas californiensis]|uniref:Transmembrane protein n=1 Tax=Alienimonas californiensis TaxID=2527989 RepID=A0A517P938_9PLAN|nr:hypothetical protein [Alienimonas californiensis]QDT15887.1 hypothetical protein CA12_19830 [Alienimonas californiensis]